MESSHEEKPPSESLHSPVRRSARPRKATRSFSPPKDNPGEKRGRKKGKTKQLQGKSERDSDELAYDLTPDGQPFSCDMCSSHYVIEPTNKKQHNRKRMAPRQRMDPATGKYLMLCNACGLTLMRRGKGGPRRIGSRTDTGATEEEKRNYFAEAKSFADCLVKSLGEPNAEKLFCPKFTSKPCRCVQNYLIEGGRNENYRKRAQNILKVIKSAQKLSLLKCYDLSAVLAPNGYKKRGHVGLGNGQKKSKAYEDYVLTQRKHFRQEYNFCEHAIKRLLGYSNNLLYKPLKSQKSSCRLEKTRRNKLHGLMLLPDMAKEKCCLGKCTLMALTHFSLLQEWREVASQGQKEARRVVAEMLTPSCLKTNCYSFIRMVTGVTNSVISSVAFHMKTTGGSREPPPHGLKAFWENHPKRRRLDEDDEEFEQSADYSTSRPEYDPQSRIFSTSKPQYYSQTPSFSANKHTDYSMAFQTPTTQMDCEHTGPVNPLHNDVLLSQNAAPSDARVLSPGGARVLSPGGARVLSPGGARVLSPGSSRILSPAGNSLEDGGHVELVTLINPDGGMQIIQVPVIRYSDDSLMPDLNLPLHSTEGSSGLIDLADAAALSAVVTTSQSDPQIYKESSTLTEASYVTTGDQPTTGITSQSDPQYYKGTLALTEASYTTTGDTGITSQSDSQYYKESLTLTEASYVTTDDQPTTGVTSEMTIKEEAILGREVSPVIVVQSATDPMEENMNIKDDTHKSSLHEYTHAISTDAQLEAESQPIAEGIGEIYNPSLSIEGAQTVNHALPEGSESNYIPVILGDGSVIFVLKTDVEEIRNLANEEIQPVELIKTVNIQSVTDKETSQGIGESLILSPTRLHLTQKMDDLVERSECSDPRSTPVTSALTCEDVQSINTLVLHVQPHSEGVKGTQLNTEPPSTTTGGSISSVATVASITPHETQPVMSQSTPVMSQSSIVMSQSTPVMSQSSIVMSQSTPVMSQSPLVMSQSTVTSQLPHMMSQSTPVMSQSSIVMSQSSATMSTMLSTVNNTTPSMINPGLTPLVVLSPEQMKLLNLDAPEFMKKSQPGNTEGVTGVKTHNSLSSETMASQNLISPPSVTQIAPGGGGQPSSITQIAPGGCGQPPSIMQIAPGGDGQPSSITQLAPGGGGQPPSITQIAPGGDGQPITSQFLPMSATNLPLLQYGATNSRSNSIILHHPTQKGGSFSVQHLPTSGTGGGPIQQVLPTANVPCLLASIYGDTNPTKQILPFLMAPSQIPVVSYANAQLLLAGLSNPLVTTPAATLNNLSSSSLSAAVQMPISSGLSSVNKTTKSAVQPPNVHIPFSLIPNMKSGNSSTQSSGTMNENPTVPISVTQSIMPSVSVIPQSIMLSVTPQSIMPSITPQSIMPTVSSQSMPSITPQSIMPTVSVIPQSIMPSVSGTPQSIMPLASTLVPISQAPGIPILPLSAKPVSHAAVMPISQSSKLPISKTGNIPISLPQVAPISRTIPIPKLMMGPTPQTSTISNSQSSTASSQKLIPISRAPIVPISRNATHKSSRFVPILRNSRIKLPAGNSSLEHLARVAASNLAAVNTPMGKPIPSAVNFSASAKVLQTPISVSTTTAMSSFHGLSSRGPDIPRDKPVAGYILPAPNNRAQTLQTLLPSMNQTSQKNKPKPGLTSVVNLPSSSAKHHLKELLPILPPSEKK